MKRYFLVKNITSNESGQSATLNTDTYTLVKKEDNDTITLPTGGEVTELEYSEAVAVVSLNIFAPTYNGIRPYKVKDNEFCKNLVLEFQSDSGALDKSTTNLLLTLLGGVLEYLSINSPHHAYTELQNVATSTVFPLVLKDKYLNLINFYLKKYPRI